MLLTDQQFVFDFKNTLQEGVAKSEGGKIISTTRKNFPAIIGNNMAMTAAFIEPCGIVLPHTHPRATEMIFVSSGRFHVGFFTENGVCLIIYSTKQ